MEHSATGAGQLGMLARPPCVLVGLDCSSGFLVCRLSWGVSRLRSGELMKPYLREQFLGDSRKKVRR